VPEVHLYRLDQSGQYREEGVLRGRVMAHLPFLVDIDLADLARPRMISGRAPLPHAGRHNDAHEFDR
jgi:hypothetical protein